MRTSENIELISTALAAAQGEFPHLEKNRDNPFFKSKYADLADIVANCRPTLSKHGLALLQPISIDNGRVVITTRLVHKSGQWFEEPLSMRPDKDSPQAIGSAATYGRRYGAEAMLGVAASVDDDGNEATGNTKNQTEATGNTKNQTKAPYTGIPQEKAWLASTLRTRGVTDPDKMREFHLKAMGKTTDDIEYMIQGGNL